MKYTGINKGTIYFIGGLLLDLIIYLFVLPESSDPIIWAGFLILSLPFLIRILDFHEGDTFFNKKFWHLSLMILSTGFLYLPSISNGFTNWDDPAYVLENPLISDFSFSSIMSSNFKGMYQPLTILTLAMDYALAGLNEHFYHFNNVILHILNVLLVYKLAIHLFNKTETGLIAALIFGLTTIHVESVAWITERKDVLYTLLFLLSSNAFIKYIVSSGRYYYILAVSWFILSVLAKPQAIVLAPILLLYSFQVEGKITKQRFIQSIPFLIIGLISGIFTILGGEGQTPDISVWDRIILSGYSFSIYLVKSFIPIHFSAIYPYPASLSFLHYLGFIASLGIIIIIIATWNKNRAIAFGLLFFTVSIFPLLQLIPNTYVLMADRYAYVPSIGLYILASQLFTTYSKKQKSSNIHYYLITIYLLIISVSSYTRAQVWENSLTLWNDTLKKYPNVPEALNNRGGAYFLSGKTKEALRDFNRALSIKPDSYQALASRGAIYVSTGKYEDAYSDLIQALKINPQEPNAYFNLGLVYERFQKKDEAIIAFTQAIDLNPRHTNALISRGAINLNSGNYESALKDFNRAIEIEPGNYLSRTNRGLAHVRLGNKQDAITDFTSAIELKPDFPDAYSNRGMTYLQLGDYRSAVGDFNIAIKLSPSMGIAYMNRGTALARSGLTEQACMDFKKALSLGVRIAENEIQKYCLNN